MGHITAISNQKGGVGKTTITVNLAKLLGARGFRVLVIDNDPQGNLTSALFADELPEGVLEAGSAVQGLPGPGNTVSAYSEGAALAPVAVPRPADQTGRAQEEWVGNLHALAATSSLVEISQKSIEAVYAFQENVRELARDYDVVLIDCLPSFGVVQTASHMAAHWLLVPTHLDSFSVGGVRAQMQNAAKIKKRGNSDLALLGIVPNEVSAVPTNVESVYDAELREEWGDKVFISRITKSTKVREANALHAGIFEYKPHSDQARQFRALADEYCARTSLGGAQ